MAAPEHPSRDDRSSGSHAETARPESPPAAPARQWTVSVVSHGQAAFCSHLLDDLARLAPPTLAKVIVTVNVPESESDFKPRPGALPFAVQFLRNARPKGFGANHNQAFARSDTPYFAVLNPDLRIPRDPFPELRRRLADAAVGVVSPLVLEADGTVADHARRLLTPGDLLRRRLTAGARSRRGGGPPDWLAGVFLAFRAETYRALAGFDERFRLYCEDADLCVRAQLAGLRIEVADEARVVHLAQRASRRRAKYLFWHLRSLATFWGSPAYRDYRDRLASAPPDTGIAKPAAGPKAAHR